MAAYASYDLNRIAIEDLGLTLEEGGPIQPALRLTRESQSMPGRVGGLPAPYANIEDRIFRFVSRVRTSSVAARIAVMDGLADALRGQVEIRDVQSPDRVTRGTVQIFEAQMPSPAFVNNTPQVVVEIRTPSARWDTSSSSRVLSTTPVQIPCGTLPHRGRIFLTGVAAGAISTEVRFKYRGISGALLKELVVLPSLASGEYAIIDLDAQQIQKVTTSNVYSDVESWITSGDYLTISPRDGNRSMGVWPTLEITAGAALYTFRRNWLG